jgi:2-oxoglutarate ferredoxin oxidoreductase subunit beta
MRLETPAKNTWCPGCGNFGILSAFKKVVAELSKEIDPKKIVICSGIGCHGKISDYINLSSFHSIHGRVPPFLEGLKLANPELIAVGFSGDGDAYNEGIAHMIHAAKRNADITMFVHNNGVYGLTTGQATATSPKGFKGRSTPNGNPEEPLNPPALMLVSGATFVARAYPGDINHLKEVMKAAILHKGFSFVDILQPCVSFNNTWNTYNRMVKKLEGHDPKNLKRALNLAIRDELYIGIFYQVSKETYERALYMGRRIDDSLPDVNRVIQTLI